MGIINHTQHNSENIFDLFPFLKKKFDVINIDKINIDNLKNLDCTKFEFIKNYNKLDNVIINKNWICYKYVFRIYNELPKDLKECFKINENVNDKDFCAIHIRYGDKLKLSIDKEKNIQFKFL